jgi:transcription initiation factor IIE alpha subunit
MPIDRDEFEESSEEALGVEEGTHADTVLTFLAENSDSAFTQAEIHDKTGIKRGSVGAVLSRLKDAGLVEHKGKYWAVSERARERLDEDGGISVWKIL